MVDILNKQKQPGYTFRDSHRPTLQSGAYKLTSKWKVTVDQIQQISGESVTDFWVAGERFSLKPSDIQAVYPPEGSRGSYQDCLPHIALARDTLPWERMAKGQETPWLALLLLNEAEAAKYKLQTITLGEYRRKLPASAKFERDHGQEDSDQVQVIELSSELIRALLPDTKELALLCHVRAKEAVNDSPESVAVVVCKRLPSHGRNTIHLVSVEGRYNDSGFDTAGQASCALISLKSWTFTCEEINHPETESLDGLFARLNSSWLQLPPSLNEMARLYLSSGFVPLPHRFRTGESGASWYAGALIPNRFLSPAARKVIFPARSADDLLWFDEGIGMLNITYAAAWELGRLLVMQNRRIFASLQTWRRQQIQRAHAAAAAGADSKASHLPHIQRACPPTAATPPTELTNWIDGLRRLRGIPFKYLVADERMLPQESIRFFSVDPQWINALLDGAMSIVRTPTEQEEHCQEAEKKLLNSAPPQRVTGALLRSRVVTGWPGLQVTALGANQQPLALYHSAQLSPSILLYLFVGDIASLTIQQTPETLHLSVENHKQNSSIWKDKTKGVLNLAALSVDSASSFATTLLHRIQKLQALVSWQ
jgi:hypothetical protein